MGGMTDTNHFKTVLTEKAGTIEKELAELGKKVATNHADWQAVSPEMGRDRADETEVADNIEQYENNSAVLEQLEKRLSEIKTALGKIESGTYGICEVSGEPIEEDRLEANPTATTCKLHMND